MKINRSVGLSSILLAVTAVVVAVAPGIAGGKHPSPKAALKAALEQLVSEPAGPPGAIAVVQHGDNTTAISAGTALLGTSGGPPEAEDHVRVASVSKAFSGAAALALVAEQTLGLNDTIEHWLPNLPKAWGAVTLGELLNHTSGVPDFSSCPAFHAAVNASPLNPPPPQELLTYVERPPCYKPLHFTPGTKYEYSNSDNVIVALMIQAATKQSYSAFLSRSVAKPLGLTATSLPVSAVMPDPAVHGYLRDPSGTPGDVTEDLAAGWSWASGGVVSTPADANRFVRAYVKGETTNAATRAKQFHFIKGDSEPPGPGTNAAGMAIFRYRTECGSVYGHTGNTLGYTQFIAASEDGHNSVAISISSQISKKTNASLFSQLEHIFELGVCASMKG